MKTNIVSLTNTLDDCLTSCSAGSQESDVQHINFQICCAA